MKITLRDIRDLIDQMEKRFGSDCLDHPCEVLVTEKFEVNNKVQQLAKGKVYTIALGEVDESEPTIVFVAQGLVNPTRFIDSEDLLPLDPDEVATELLKELSPGPKGRTDSYPPSNN